MEQFKQILNAADLEGKVIKSVFETDYRVVVHFHNNEFCVFSVCGYDSPYVEILDAKMDLEIRSNNIWDLKNYGLMSESEWSQLRKKFDEEERLKKEKEERTLYERLLKKYS